MTRLLLDVAANEGCNIKIIGDELHYITRVRRHVPGNAVELLDSNGQRFAATVEEISKSHASLKIEKLLPAAPDALPVHLIVAVPKRNLFDDVVRKSNEIGVARITPVTTKRSTATANDAKLDRWRKIASESIRQCGRRRPICVDPVTNLELALNNVDSEDLRLILHPGENSLSITDLLTNQKVSSAVVAVGPEGGFTDDEITCAKNKNFCAVGLGSFVLRVETAAIVAAILSAVIVGGLD